MEQSSNLGRMVDTTKKLSKAFSDIDTDDWDELPGSNNPVESINRQIVPENAKLVSLKSLIEHIYLEDTALQVATEKGITIRYSKNRKRTSQSKGELKLL